MPSKAANIDIRIAKRFILVREYLKMTQRELAKLCGVVPSTIARIEGGSRDLSPAILKILYQKYNISPVFILSGDGPIEYKKEKQTLITNLRDLESELEIMKGQIKKIEGDIRIITKAV